MCYILESNYRGHGFYNACKKVLKGKLNMPAERATACDNFFKVRVFTLDSVCKGERETYKSRKHYVRNLMQTE